MKIAAIDPTAAEFSGEELDAMVELLAKADAIRADRELHDRVKERAKNKAKEISSVAELRKKREELSGA